MPGTDPATAALNLAADVVLEIAQTQARLNTPEMIAAKAKQDEVDRQAEEAKAVASGDLETVRKMVQDTNLPPT